MSDELDTSADSGTADDTTGAEIETADESAGTENTETAETVADEAGAEGPIPYRRFHEVNEAKKAAEAELATAKAKLAALEKPAPEPEKPKPDPKAKLKGGIPKAPDGLSAEQQFEWYVRSGLDMHVDDVMEDYFQRKFGQSPDAVAAITAQNARTTRDTIIKDYTAAAKSRGLDPENTHIKKAVGLMMDSGEFETFSAAFESLYGPAKKATPTTRATNGHGAEIDGLDPGALSRVRSMPKTTKEAMNLAAAGKMIEQPSVTEILANFGKK